MTLDSNQVRRRLTEARDIIDELLAEHMNHCTLAPCPVTQAVVSWALNTKVLMQEVNDGRDN